jgi:hypothetical protein
MAVLPSYTFSGDIGRINPYEEEVLEKTISCPQIKSFGIQIEHNTVSEKQCRVRIENKSRCAKHCVIAKRIIDSDPH